MKNQLSLESVQNHLDHLKASNPELKEFIFVPADGRLGKLIALGLKGEYGSVSVKTDFMSYSEMNQFLRGYSFKSENRLVSKTI